MIKKKRDKLNKVQLREGTLIEMEHTKSKRVAKKIATDHLKEFPGAKYYTELKKMEQKLNKEVKKHDKHNR
jgi:hypothetical protein